MSKIAVISTFPNYSWEIYAKKMLASFIQYWPADIQLLVALDDNLLEQDVRGMLKDYDAVSCKWSAEHKAFVDRNKDKDHPTDYRKQAVKFCHKVFSIKQSLNAIEQMENGPRYLIWMDADVITTRPITMADIDKCLPKEGDAVAYLGRKDWDHSECGWLVFDLENGGKHIIETIYSHYITDNVFDFPQWHDSYIWDQTMLDNKTNLTEDKPGMEIWPQSPMASWSRHYKGPEAKKDLMGVKMPPSAPKGQGLQIQTKNSLPDETIQDNILKNQAQITNWLKECLPSDEEIIVVSAGPMLIPEDIETGKKIVAVKHALEPLRESGIKPWACILLDPREHLHKFVENPDKDMLWFVASQVDPRVVAKLLDEGCQVWGYHAAVGAGETKLTERQHLSIVSGGSATATRGLFLLSMLGFKNFSLYGYDLCFADKPNMDELDKYNQPMNFEMSFEIKMPYFKQKRAFWSKAELIAQYQEMNDIINQGKWNLKAHGQGIIPFLVNGKRINDLRKKRKQDKIASLKPIKYEELLNGPTNWPNGSECGTKSTTD